MLDRVIPKHTSELIEVSLNFIKDQIQIFAHTLLIKMWQKTVEQILFLETKLYYALSSQFCFGGNLYHGGSKEKEKQL